MVDPETLMTNRERFLAFASFEPVDRVPRYANYVESLRRKLTQQLGKDPYEYFNSDIGGGARLQPPVGYTPPDYSVYHPGKVHGSHGFTIDQNGCGHQEHGYFHFTEYISPLREAEDFKAIESYPFVDNANWNDREMRQAAEDSHARDNYASVFLGHMYENAWQVRGYEPFLLDLLTQRDWAEFILDKFCANNDRAAVAAARAGYDCMAIGDDVANQNAMMFSPNLWREVMKPRWAKVIASARAIKRDIHVWYHSDGNISEILDDLVEIGITILNPVQPECMNPLAIRQRFGKRLAFDGCIGTQTTFPFGTSAEMRRVVAELARELDAENGGLMLSPTHILEPEVPHQNIIAFFEACDTLRGGVER